MSKTKLFTIAALFAVLAGAAVAAPGRGGGGGARANANRIAGGGRNNRNNNAATLNPDRRANVRSNAVHNALNSRAVAGALRHTAALRSPNTRARIVAVAATAGWHDGRDRGPWSRPRNGRHARGRPAVSPIPCPHP